jgi:hypothetical protein
MRGARWLAEGWRLFRAAPLAWLGLSCAYLLGTNLLALVPLVGIVAALGLVPPLTVGMMAAARATSAGGRPALGMLFEGLRTQTRTQLALGAVYVACSMMIFAATLAADGSGALRELLSGRGSAQTDMQAVAFPLAVLALLYLPVMMLFWFSPPLAAWHATGAARALFFSFIACLMNWRAFIGYGIATLVMMVVVPGVALLGMRLLLGGELGVSAMSLVLPLLILVVPALFASFYASYRDVFGVERQ